MGLGRMTNKHSYERAQNQTTSWLVHSWSTFGAKKNHEQTQIHKTHHNSDSREATTFPLIVYFMPGHGTITQISFCLATPKRESRNSHDWDSIEKNLDNFIIIDSKLLSQFLAWKSFIANFKYVNTYKCCCLVASSHMVLWLALFIFMPPLQTGGVPKMSMFKSTKTTSKNFFVASSHFYFHTFRGIIGLLAPIFFTLWK